MADLDYLFGSALGMGLGSKPRAITQQESKKPNEDSGDPTVPKTTEELIDLFSEPKRESEENRVVVSSTGFGFSPMADFFPTSNIEWLDYATVEKEEKNPAPPEPKGPVVVDLLSDQPVDSVLEVEEDPEPARSIATEESIETELEEPEVDLIGVSDMIGVSEVPAHTDQAQHVDDFSRARIITGWSSDRSSRRPFG